MRTETRYVYIAYDDTVFKTEAECREYENKVYFDNFLAHFELACNQFSNLNLQCLLSGENIAEFIEANKDLVEDYVRFLNNQEEK